MHHDRGGVHKKEVMIQQGPTVYHRELCSILCGSVDGKGIEWNMDTCKSLGCSPETITILLIGYTSIENWRRQWQPTPVLLPGKSHGWRSLVGCNPRGHEDSDMTERLHFQFSLTCPGEGNGSPLQCSCLENPRDGGAWWAAVYRVTQSRTRLK